jgi:hypothetical protein
VLVERSSQTRCCTREEEVEASLIVPLEAEGVKKMRADKRACIILDLRSHIASTLATARSASMAFRTKLVTLHSPLLASETSASALEGPETAVSFPGFSKVCGRISLPRQFNLNHRTVAAYFFSILAAPADVIREGERRAGTCEASQERSGGLPLPASAITLLQGPSINKSLFILHQTSC